MITPLAILCGLVVFALLMALAVTIGEEIG